MLEMTVFLKGIAAPDAETVNVLNLFTEFLLFQRSRQSLYLVYLRWDSKDPVIPGIPHSSAAEPLQCGYSLVRES